MLIQIIRSLRCAISDLPCSCVFQYASQTFYKARVVHVQNVPNNSLFVGACAWFGSFFAGAFLILAFCVQEQTRRVGVFAGAHVTYRYYVRERLWQLWIVAGPHMTHGTFFLHVGLIAGALRSFGGILPVRSGHREFMWSCLHGICSATLVGSERVWLTQTTQKSFNDSTTQRYHKYRHDG